MSWADNTKEDAVAGDAADPATTAIDPSAAAGILGDPALTADPTLDYSVLARSPADTTNADVSAASVSTAT